MALPISAEDVGRVAAERAANGTPIERLAGAIEVAGELHELADVLIDRYVREAREAGCSWAEIGRVLGVTRQAAQQRFVAPEPTSPVWPRTFTEPARRAVARGAETARSLGHDYLGTEHVLLGLLAEEDGVAAAALAALEVTEEAVRERFPAALAPAVPFGQGPRCVMPRLKQALELARRQASAFGLDDAAPEHLLLGMLHVPGALATEILADLGATEDRVRAEVADRLGVDSALLAAAARPPRRPRFRRPRRDAA